MSINALLRTTAAPLLAVSIALCATGCGPRGDTPPPADDSTADAAAQGPVVFVDRAAEMGITAVAVAGNPEKLYFPEVFGSGVAVADYDGDGDLDLYLGTQQTRDDWAAGRAPRSNSLYRNNGDGTFTDVAAEAGVALAGWTTGTYFVDYDNDGDRDLFVVGWGPDVLYRNDGDGTFTDVTAAAGVAGPPKWTGSAAFGDLDGDGDLDLYVTGYVEFDFNDPPFDGTRTFWNGIEVMVGPLGLVAVPDRLYRNDGDGSFTDVTVEAGIDTADDPSYGLGLVMSDLDGDGDLDVYVANDSRANYLWRNDGNLRFTEIAARAGVATNEDARDQAGMGTDAGDYDGDGQMDLVVTNFSHDFNTLYRNLGDLVFADATFEAKLSDSFSTLVWGTKFLDYDNDALLDLVVANGHTYPEVDDAMHLGTRFRQRNSLYRNLGEGGFDNVTETAGPGFEIVEGSRGLAVADLDRDGDLDIIITNLDTPPNVLINEGGDARGFVIVELVGTASNRDAIGARVELEAGGRTRTREVNPFGSFASQGAYAVHFGLGDLPQADRIVVRWPSGRVDERHDVPARTFLTITEGQQP